MKKFRPVFLLCSLLITTFYLSLNAQQLNYDFDYAFSGQVLEDGSGFTMQLTAQKGTVEGFYQMVGISQKTAVRGTFNDIGELNLNVTDADGNTSGKITARFINDNQILGSWQATGQGTISNFILKPAMEEEQVALEVEEFLLGETEGGGLWGTGNTPVENTFELAPPPPVMAPTTIEWTEDSHDFGKIRQGAVVSHRFTFKNSRNPLKIENVKPSCGCTTPDWSKGEILPGEEGFINVEFDSKGKSGMQHKSVTVISNTTPKAKVLSFEGEVVTE